MCYLMGKKRLWSGDTPTHLDCVEWFCLRYDIRTYGKLIDALRDNDCELARYVLKTGKGSMTRRAAIEKVVAGVRRELDARDEATAMYQLLADCGVPFDSHGMPLGIG